jgi:uncharacterized protein
MSNEPQAIFDSHTHLFSPSIIARVSRLEGLAASLRLNIYEAGRRSDKATLKDELRSAGVQACLLLPTAPVDAVRKINDQFLQFVEGEESLCTAGTIHPSYPAIDEELARLSRGGIRAIKLSSFSQRIDLESGETFRMFEKIRAHNVDGKSRFFVILDTFYQADLYFGTARRFLTTPERLGRLVTDFPEINFVGAHMGGLAAPFREIESHLPPRRNLYLDTSNASHVLSRLEFLRLLDLHGPERILFGTDWPWFGHRDEVPRIQGLLHEAGFSSNDASKVFGENIRRLLDIRPKGIFNAASRHELN